MPLYQPALAGAPPEEGNWNYLGRFLFQTRLYHLGGSFQTPLYHLHPCRRAFVAMTPLATPYLSCQERQSSMTPTKPSSQETIGTEAKAPWVTLPRA